LSNVLFPFFSTYINAELYESESNMRQIEYLKYYNSMIFFFAMITYKGVEVRDHKGGPARSQDILSVGVR
jgi:hypothetical protein